MVLNFLSYFRDFHGLFNGFSCILNGTKFLIKVRKPHFKLRKALFKRGLERNRKSKNDLEFDVEKNVWIIFLNKIFCLKEIILLMYAMQC